MYYRILTTRSIGLLNSIYLIVEYYFTRLVNYSIQNTTTQNGLIILNKRKGIFFVEKNVFSFDTIQTDDKITKREAFIGFNDLKIPFTSGEKNIIGSTQNMCLTMKKWKKQKTYMTLSKEDVELKGLDDGGQDVKYGVDFLKCKTIN